MKVLFNRSQRMYQYGFGENVINFAPDSKAEFEDEVANSFLKSPEVELVSDDTAMKAKDAEIAKLKAEAKAKAKEEAEAKKSK